MQMSPPPGKNPSGFGGASPPPGKNPSVFGGASPPGGFGGKSSSFGGNSPNSGGGGGGGGGGGSSGFGAEFPPAAAVMDANGNPPEFAAPVQLHPCSLCGRKFNEKALVKHSKICAKASAKRKVFNMQENRVDAEALKLVKEAEKNGGKKKAEEEAAKKKEKAALWKAQSSALRDAMSANKEIAKAKKEGRDLSTLPPPKASAPDPSLVQCPHCSRRFNATAAERHIPKCNDIKAKPKMLKRGTGGMKMPKPKTDSGAMGKSNAGNRTRTQRKR